MRTAPGYPALTDLKLAARRRADAARKEKADRYSANILPVIRCLRGPRPTFGLPAVAQNTIVPNPELGRSSSYFCMPMR
jgi:hypothetical protein